MTSTTTPTGRPAQQAAQVAQAVPEVISLLAAGRLLGLSRSTTYRLAQAGEFPCRVLRIGGRYAVPVRGLRALLDHTNQQDGGQDRPAGEEG